MSLVEPPRIGKGNTIIGFGGIPVNYTMNMREALPALIPLNAGFSIWAIIKNSIGKDLTRITMPIQLNEPISMLQKIAEQCKFTPIMDKALEMNDDYKRLALIAVYTLAQYAEISSRNKKPFNPILGETYEIIQPNYRFVAEQVSHHPPVTAFHLEGNGYSVTGDTTVKTSFRGASLEFKSESLWHINLTNSGEHIVIKRPDGSANNLIIGKLYIDVHGTLEVTNVTKNLKCVLNIHRIGWTMKNAYKVEGQVVDENQQPRYEVFGRWNEILSIKDLSNGREETVFRADPPIPNAERMY